LNGRKGNLQNTKEGLQTVIDELKTTVSTSKALALSIGSIVATEEANLRLTTATNDLASITDRLKKLDAAVLKETFFMNSGADKVKGQKNIDRFNLEKDTLTILKGKAETAIEDINTSKTQAKEAKDIAALLGKGTMDAMDTVKTRAGAAIESLQGLYDNASSTLATQDERLKTLNASITSLNKKDTLTERQQKSLNDYITELGVLQIEQGSSSQKTAALLVSLDNAKAALAEAKFFIDNDGKSEEDLYKEAQEAKAAAEEAARKRKEENERLKNLQKEMAAAAAAAAEEEKRKKEEEARQAEVDRQRVLAEQAALNALGLGERVKAIEERIAAGGLSKFEEYTLGEDLKKFKQQKKAFDDEKKAKEKALAEQEAKAKREAAEAEAARQKAEAEAAKAKAAAEAQAKVKAELEAAEKAAADLKKREEEKAAAAAELASKVEELKKVKQFIKESTDADEKAYFME
jgi:hypothetical protein